MEPAIENNSSVRHMTMRPPPVKLLHLAFCPLARESLFATILAFQTPSPWLRWSEWLAAVAPRR